MCCFDNFFNQLGDIYAMNISCIQLNWVLFCIDMHQYEHNYRQVSNIRRTLVGNQIVDHSDVVGASPVGAAPTTSSFST